MEKHIQMNISGEIYTEEYRKQNTRRDLYRKQYFEKNIQNEIYRKTNGKTHGKRYPEEPKDQNTLGRELYGEN